MFEAVYIADPKGILAFEYLVFSHVPTFSALLPTISANLSGQEPLQHAQLNDQYSLYAAGNSRFVVYLLCSTRQLQRQFHPAMPAAFLDTLADVMADYFGTPLTPSKIAANNDTLTLLLYHMISAGVPNTVDRNNLRDVVSSKGILSKLLSTGNQLASAAATKSMASLTTNYTKKETDTHGIAPWRRSTAKYANNEMFLDVVERVNVILRPSRPRRRHAATQNFDSAFYSSAASASSAGLAAVTASLSGRIDFLSRITGIPELQVRMNSAAASLAAPSFHRCMNLQSWRDSKTLSFIPPDGQSTLMTYQVDLDSLSEKNRASMLGLLEFDLQHGLGLQRDEFELRVLTSASHEVAKIERLDVQVFAYERAPAEDNDAADNDAADEANGVSKMKVVRVSDGDFRYQGNGCGLWSIKNLQTGTQPVLRVAIHANDDAGDFSDSAARNGPNSVPEPAVSPVAPMWLKVDFSYKGQVPSGLKVNDLKIVASKGMGDSVKPFKGVRYTTEAGDYSIRSQ